MTRLPENDATSDFDWDQGIGPWKYLIKKCNDLEDPGERKIQSPSQVIGICAIWEMKCFFRLRIFCSLYR